MLADVYKFTLKDFRTFWFSAFFPEYYPREKRWECKQISQYIAHENGFVCVQNQSLDRCKQISQFIAHENGFGCIQNQSLGRSKQTIQFIAHENGFGCIQNQSLDRCK
jgi:hypothetical protein